MIFKKITISLLVFLISFLFISCSKDGFEENKKIGNISFPVFEVTNNWGKDAIGYEASDITNIKIGIIDSANYYQSSNVKNYSVHPSEQSDITYHGSFIVSALCSLLPKTDIVSINVADEKGNISEESLALGIAYAIKQKCDIINISLGTQKNYSIVEREISNAIESGIIIIAAAGNESRPTLDYPANYNGVISVMSRNFDNIDDRTNNISVEKKSFSAPNSIVFNNQYVFSGSSIATVYITAEVAHVVSSKPDISYLEVQEVLEKSSIYSTEYSYGMINHKLVVNNLNN